MKRVRTWRLAPLLLIPVLALLAACGGGSSTPATSTVAAAASSTSHGDEGAFELFKAASAKFAAIPAYTATYNVKVNNLAGASFSATVTFAHKATLTRIDFDGTVNGKATRFTTLQDGDKLTVCQSQTSSCAATTTQTNANPLASLDPIGIVQTVVSDPSLQVAAAPSQTFAGITATCFAATQQAQSSSFCIDPKTGILLLAVGKSAATGAEQFTESIAATAASTEVAAVDTATPYPLAK